MLNNSAGAVEASTSQEDLSSEKNTLVRLLLIEDNKSDAIFFEKTLSKAKDAGRYSISCVQKLSDALSILTAERFDIIVSDLSLPDSTGLQTVEALHRKFPLLTIVVLTGLDNEEVGLAAIQAGAQDYLVKSSFKADELSMAIRYAIERQKTLIQAKVDRSRYEYSADHDPLTDLPNRHLFNDRLDQAINRAKRNLKSFAVIFLDLDGFKEVNDAFGHRMGDSLLIAVADKFKKAIRESDTVARWGGDEFVFLIEDLKMPKDAGVISKKLVSLFKDPIVIDSHNLPVTASIGTSIYPLESERGDELLELADAAMYRAKELGKNQFRFSSPSLNVHENSSSEQERALLDAMENHQLEVHYQPQVDLKTKSYSSMQALMRWNHPDWGCLPAQDFIHLAESSGLIFQLNEWLLNAACAQLKIWHAEGQQNLHLFINLSRFQMQRKDLIATFAKIIADNSLMPSYITFEVTEADILISRDRNIEFLKDLRKIGVRLALDSFGTGNSSMGTIRAIPFDTVKIDRSLIGDLKTDESGYRIVEALVDVIHGFGMRSMAEGVESETQAKFLEKIGCQFAQGYFYGRPLVPQKFKQFVWRPGPVTLKTFS